MSHATTWLQKMCFYLFNTTHSHTLFSNSVFLSPHPKIHTVCFVGSLCVVHPWPGSLWQERIHFRCGSPTSLQRHGHHLPRSPLPILLLSLSNQQGEYQQSRTDRLKLVSYKCGHSRPHIPNAYGPMISLLTFVKTLQRPTSHAFLASLKNSDLLALALALISVSD